MPTIDTADYKDLFLSTAQEHLQEVTSLLHRAENGDEPATSAQEIFRHIHSLKGSSSVMNYSEIGAICDKIDQLLHPDANTFSIDSKDIAAIKTYTQNIKDILTTLETS